MEQMILNGHQFEYDDDIHTYRVDGIIVPSVTQLLNRKFGHKYDDIPKDVLKKAAEKGTRVHLAVECYCRGFDDGSREVRNFKFLKKYYGFEVKENELPIILTIGGKVYAGRLDMIFSLNDELAVADIKTTTTLDKEYLGHQLNLYRIGVEQTYKMNIKKLYGIHLREDTRKLVEIPIKEEEWLLQSLGLNEQTEDTE